MNRSNQIIIVSILTSTVIIVIGYYSIPFEQQKMSYTIDAITQRNNSGESQTVLTCEKSYPDLCIPHGNTALTCENIMDRSFNVIHDDPNNLDPDKNGIGCEN